MKALKTTVLSAALLLCGMVLMVSCSANNDQPVVPGPEGDEEHLARYTVIMYGNSGGQMDDEAEKLAKSLIPVIKADEGDLRFFVLYKYGKDTVVPDDEEEGKLIHLFKGKYADPESVVGYEVNDQLEMEDIRQSAVKAPDFELYDPANLTDYLNEVARMAPAREYIFLLWGHGGGYDARHDLPWSLKLSAEARPATRAVLYDETLDHAAMDMYEFSKGIADSNIKHFKCIFFHNCLQGNMESLAEVQPYADYAIASMHELASMTDPVVDMIKGLASGQNIEEAAQGTFSRLPELMKNSYFLNNGDLRMIRMEGMTEINKQVSRLSGWLCENYAADNAKRAAVDRATDKVYRLKKDLELFDIADYAEKLATETADATVQDISHSLRAAFRSAFVHNVKFDADMISNLPEYSLSAILCDKDYYQNTKPVAEADYSFGAIYQGTAFHKQTEWGKWLNTNEHKPKGNPIGQFDMGY